MNRQILRRCLPAGVAALALVLGGGQALAAGVDPASFEASLVLGQSASVTKTVHTPAIPPKVDIVFLADTTGSMGPTIANVKANAASILGQVRAAQPDSDFGAAQYRDFNCPPDPFAYQLTQPVTSSLANAENGIDAWSIGDGCDVPEAQINALWTLATNPATAFRPGSTRIVVWFGDSNGHDPSGGHALDDAIAALQAAHVEVIAIPVLTDFGNGLNNGGQASAIAGATGGQVLPDATADEVSNAILAGLSNLVVTVTPMPTCDAGLAATYDVPSDTVTSGQDATFQETVTVGPGAPAGATLHCSVDFLLNGNHQDGFQQTVTIFVVGLAGGGTFVIGDGDSAVGTQVTFWGAQWWKRNSLSGGSAPASFKGFALTPASPTCGGTWTTAPGNSPPPPAGPLPPLMAVIVTGSSSKSGPTISGDIRHIVVVRTDPGYAPNPGHAGTGTVVGQIC